MRIKEGFMLREVAGSYAVIPVGKASADFNGMITLNGVGAFLWEQFSRETTEEQVLQAVLDAYEVEREQAIKNIRIFVKNLREAELLAEDV